MFQIYLMDIHIWYTLLSAIIGGVMGARSRLGEVFISSQLQQIFSLHMLISCSFVCTTYSMHIDTVIVCFMVIRGKCLKILWNNILYSPILLLLFTSPIYIFIYLSLHSFIFLLISLHYSCHVLEHICISCSS